jgi:hypothetical protein
VKDKASELYAALDMFGVASLTDHEVKSLKEILPKLDELSKKMLIKLIEPDERSAAQAEPTRSAMRAQRVGSEQKALLRRTKRPMPATLQPRPGGKSRSKPQKKVAHPKLMFDVPLSFSNSSQSQNHNVDLLGLHPNAGFSAPAAHQSFEEEYTMPRFRMNATTTHYGGFPEMQNTLENPNDQHGLSIPEIVAHTVFDPIEDQSANDVDGMLVQRASSNADYENPYLSVPHFWDHPSGATSISPLSFDTASANDVDDLLENSNGMYSGANSVFSMHSAPATLQNHHLQQQNALDSFFTLSGPWSTVSRTNEVSLEELSRIDWDGILGNLPDNNFADELVSEELGSNHFFGNPHQYDPSDQT